MTNESLRAEIDRELAAGEGAIAASLLQSLWRTEGGSAAAGFIVARTDRFRTIATLLPYRVALLRSFTLEPLVPMLRASALVNGIDLTVHLSDFNTYQQEILDPSGTLYSGKFDAVILAIQTCDIAPELWRNSADLNAADIKKVVARVVGQYRSMLQAFRKQSQASLIVHNLELPASPAAGILDAMSESSQAEAIREINTELRKLCREFRGVYLLDYDALVARAGRSQWRDERKWLTVRLPIAAPHLQKLADEWVRFLVPLSGKIAKALVVDLDNTLWGGVIGEDGMTGIKLGAEYPGAAFVNLQRAMLDLYQRGILLAICSKNNLDDAMEVLNRHEAMLVKPPHFACMRINWQEKAQNLREIAKELNIGIDSLAFLDDNAIERQHVRSMLPQVQVLEPPDNPMDWAQFVRDYPGFQRLTLSEEDKERGKYYAAQKEREALEQHCATREDFYESLQQEAEIAPVGPATLQRAAQLTQKTNQFNTTTRRYSEQQVAGFLTDPSYRVLTIKVTDRYADNGIVGVAITRDADGVCEIDTFLLSCRVIGRTVETAMLSYLVEQARARGMQKIRGWFLPTPKNKPVADFYSRHAFREISSDSKGTLWELDLASSNIECPQWIKLLVPEACAR